VVFRVCVETDLRKYIFMNAKLGIMENDHTAFLKIDT
jgi:hypothetical protein